MNDLFDIVEDLEELAEMAETPGFWVKMEYILPKWKEKLAEAQEANEAQLRWLFD